MANAEQDASGQAVLEKNSWAVKKRRARNEWIQRVQWRQRFLGSQLYKEHDPQEENLAASLSKKLNIQQKTSERI